MTEYGIPEDVLSDIAALLRKYADVKKAAIFGSRAKNSYRRYSDIDIAIWCDDTPLPLYVERIKSDLDELPTIYTYDVVSYNEIENPALREHIDRVGRSIYTAAENL